MAEDPDTPLREETRLLGRLLGEVLRFYGPVGRELPAQTLALDPERERVALEVLDQGPGVPVLLKPLGTAALAARLRQMVPEPGPGG